MTKNYDVIIVGAGLLGCSVAYHLSRQSNIKVALIERGMVGMQTSSLAASLVTRGRPTRSLCELTMATFNAIDDLEKSLGSSLDFNHVGSMHVAQSEESAKSLMQQVDMLKEFGDHPIELTCDQAKEKSPWLNIDHADYIVFNPLDGFIDPYRLACAYLQGAKLQGQVDIFQSTEVTQLLMDGAQVIGVDTDKGVFNTEQVVLAAGPWVNQLLKPIGSRAAMAPVRSHYWITGVDTIYPVKSPVVIMPEAKAYARPEVGSLIFGIRDQDSKWAHPESLPKTLHGFSFDDDFEGWEALEQSISPFLELCPSLENVEIKHYISGPSGYTPDGKQLIGLAPNLEGVYLASGCCGLGVAISGGVGSVLASLVLGENPTIDLSQYNPDRFGEFDPYDTSFLERCALSRSMKREG